MRKEQYLISKIIQLSSIIIAFICFILAIKTELYKAPIYLIPICYSLSTFILNKKDFNLPGIFIFKVILFWRYSLMSLAFYISDGKFKFIKNYNYLDEAVYLMILEMFCIVLILKFTEKKNKFRTLDKYIKIFYQSNIKGVIAIFMTLGIVMVSLKYRSLLRGITLILGNKILYNYEDVPVIIAILYRSIVLWLYVYTIFLLRQKNKNINWSLSISIAYILFTFLGQSGISRWNTIVTFLSIVFLLIKLYPKHRKKILFNILLPSLAFIMILTIYKNTSYLYSKDKVLLIHGIRKLLNAEMLNLYFAGPININSAIGTSKKFVDLSLKTLPLDLASGIPIINHYVNELKTSFILFNIYIGRYFGKIGQGNYDQIIPLIGQGYIYFSFWLSPLLTVFSIMVFRYCDKKFYYSKNLTAYIFAFTGIWAATAIILNLTIFTSWIFIRIIPFVVVFKSIDWIEIFFSKY